MKNILILITAFLLLFSCEGQEQKKMTLILDPVNSTISDERFITDSICFIYRDSLNIFYYSKNYTFKTHFFNQNGNYYELRTSFNDIGEDFGIDTILTFGKRDTTFYYKSKHEFIPIVFNYSLADCQYTITKEDDLYITTKQSLEDSTYTEVFYYDKDYNIIKFVNIYQDNKCIYIPK